MNKPDTSAVLNSLKDFQRRTVDHVFDRFYGPDPARRFLVADEVGLGKTLVARGLIARTIDHLWDKQNRIEIIYICSNQDIAKQNVARLMIDGCGDEALGATRLSMLPLSPRSARSQRVDFLSLTPGTSFDMTGGAGEVRERALLYRMLQSAWSFGDAKPATYVLRGWAEKGFERALESITEDKIDSKLLKVFAARIKSQPELRKEFSWLCEQFHRSNAVVDDTAKERRRTWLGTMRRELTRVCIGSLKPSLIIMDEFQRFRDLLSTTNAEGEENSAGQLAADLFDYANDAEGRAAKTLLLSATPYKMLSLHHEQADDHFDDLLRTLSFLDPAGNDSVAAWRQRFSGYQKSFHSLRDVTQQRDALSQHLRRVMVRTERLAASRESGDMLLERDLEANDLRAGDVKAWLGLQAIADHLKQGDTLDYWKSAPYVLNFMDRYQLSDAFHKQAKHDAQLHRLVARHPDTFLPTERVERYQPLAPQHPRLRALERETLESDAWKLLWIPPALPHYELGEPFRSAAKKGITKTLIFSAWHVVPKALAAMLSYEAERRMMRLTAPRGPLPNTAEARKRRKGLLIFKQEGRGDDSRCAAMALMLLVYPSPSLAKLADPLQLMREGGASMSTAKLHLEEALRPLLNNAPTRGQPDERWYWAAPILLDQRLFDKAQSFWWPHPKLAEEWLIADEEEPDAPTSWAKHVSEASTVKNLGRVPHDLLDVLAETAFASPAVCALRALVRDDRAQEVAWRIAAGRVGHAFLSLFNVPEVKALITSLDHHDDWPYWRRVLSYAAAGGLQAVLDEFVHLLREDRERMPQSLSEEICTAVRAHASTLRVEHIAAHEGKRRVTVDDEPSIGMRQRFAMRFGDARGETEKGGARKEVVRKTFNSPFWPFVLISTSVGQEGLDFHRYCHRVVHWNLPSNPVDLEQREGRVHRYKGHAVRKNVAAQHRDAMLTDAPDVWQSVFAAAAQARPPDESEMHPYWIYPGTSKIERCLPNLPLSREVMHFKGLRRALTVYRMAFGQARQEDVIEHLLAGVPDEEREALGRALMLDLSPDAQACASGQCCVC